MSKCEPKWIYLTNAFFFFFIFNSLLTRHLSRFLYIGLGGALGGAPAGLNLGGGVRSLRASRERFLTSCSLNDVSDHKLFDSFVLWDTAGAVGAPNRLDMPTSLLGTSVIPSFLGHLGLEGCKELLNQYFESKRNEH